MRHSLLTGMCNQITEAFPIPHRSLSLFTSIQDDSENRRRETYSGAQQRALAADIIHRDATMESSVGVPATGFQYTYALHLQCLSIFSEYSLPAFVEKNDLV